MKLQGRQGSQLLKVLPIITRRHCVMIIIDAVLQQLVEHFQQHPPGSQSTPQLDDESAEWEMQQTSMASDADADAACVGYAEHDAEHNAIANPAPVAVHSSSWEMQQTSSGGSFWRHTVTGETSWQCPPGHMASDAAASKTRYNDQQSRLNPQRHQHRHPRQCARPSTQLSPPSCNPPVRSTRASNNIESYKPPFMCSK